ncbi:UNVERIFIED_CONTAM: hypothetical protein NCL1_39394 [Trichonephila clavipes]
MLWYGESNRNRKCVPLNNSAKNVFLNEKLDICFTSSNSKEFTMANFPAHMFHIGELILISVNTFQKQTRVHIRVYATDDRGILQPTKNRVSLKPEVWSALHSKLCGFRPREDFENSPQGFQELFESLCKCLTKYVSNTISLFVKLDCAVCQDDFILPKIHECMNTDLPGSIKAIYLFILIL